MVSLPGSVAGAAGGGQGAAAAAAAGTLPPRRAAQQEQRQQQRAFLRFSRSHSSPFLSTAAALLTLLLCLGSFAQMTVAKSSEDVQQSPNRALTSLERVIAAAQSPSQVAADRTPARVHGPSGVAKVVREVLENNSSLPDMGLSSKWPGDGIGPFPMVPDARLGRKRRARPMPRRQQQQQLANDEDPRISPPWSRTPHANGAAPQRHSRRSQDRRTDSGSPHRAERGLRAPPGDLDATLGASSHSSSSSSPSSRQSHASSSREDRDQAAAAAAAFVALAESLAADARRQEFIEAHSQRGGGRSHDSGPGDSGGGRQRRHKKHSWFSNESVRKWFSQQFWGVGFAKSVLSHVLTGITTLVILSHVIRKLLEHARRRRNYKEDALRDSDHQLDLEASLPLVPPDYLHSIGEWDFSRRVSPAVVAPLIPMGSASEASQQRAPVDKNAQWLIPLPADSAGPSPFWSHEFRERRDDKRSRWNRRRLSAAAAASDSSDDDSDSGVEGAGEPREEGAAMAVALVEAADLELVPAEGLLPVVEARAVAPSVRAPSMVGGLAIPLGSSDPNAVPPTSILNAYVEVRPAELAEPMELCRHIAIELADRTGAPSASAAAGAVGAAPQQPVHRCLVCEKTFSQTGNLNFHIRAVHDDERRFVCNFPDCGHSFSKKQNLTTHVRTHTGLKPFVCSLCHKSFARRNNLTRHLRTHTGARPYLCPEAGCLRRFADKSNLNTHMVTHTGQRKFECSMCHSRFFRRAHLKKHMRTHATDPASLAALLEQVGSIEALGDSDDDDDDSDADSDDSRSSSAVPSRRGGGQAASSSRKRSAPRRRPASAASSTSGAAKAGARAPVHQTRSSSRRKPPARSASRAPSRVAAALLPASVPPMLTPLNLAQVSAGAVPSLALPLQPLGLDYGGPLPLSLLLPEPLPAPTPAGVSSRSASATRSDNGSLVSSHSASTVSPHADSDAEGDDSSSRCRRGPNGRLLTLLPALVEDATDDSALGALAEDDLQRPCSPVTPSLGDGTSRLGRCPSRSSSRAALPMVMELSDDVQQEGQGEAYTFPTLPGLPSPLVASPLIPSPGSPSAAGSGAGAGASSVCLDLAPGFTLLPLREAPQPQPSGSSPGLSGVPVPLDMPPVQLPAHHGFAPLTPTIDHIGGGAGDGRSSGFGASMPAASFAGSFTPAGGEAPAMFELPVFDPVEDSQCDAGAGQPGLSGVGDHAFGTPRFQLNGSDDFSSWLTNPFE